MPEATSGQGLAFISYAREDEEEALRLYHDLKRRGAKLWLDKEDLVGGANWQIQIREAIEASSHFIALISQHSVGKRGTVQRELRLARRELLKLPPSQIFIIPVRLDSSKPQFRHLKVLHWIDLFDSYDKGLASILRSLGLSPAAAGDPPGNAVQSIELKVHAIFTPSSPVESLELLYGRHHELRQIERAHRSRGESVAIYGDPGVGKTSLAKAAERTTPGSYYRSLSRRDTFSSIAASIASFYDFENSLRKDFTAAGFAILLAVQKALVILDDFDLIQAAEREVFGEIITMLANHRSQSTLVLVGSASSVGDLLPVQHRILEKVLAIPLTPLGGETLAEILNDGFVKLGLIDLAPEASSYILKHSGHSIAMVHKYAVNSIYALLERISAGEKTERVIGIDECQVAETYDPGVG